MFGFYKIKSDDIVEISFLSTNKSYRYRDDFYDDELVVGKNKVSYIRKYELPQATKGNAKTIKWFHATNDNNKYDKSFANLCKDFVKACKNYKDNYITDVPMFSFTAKLKDETKVNINGYRIAYENPDFKKLAEDMLSFVFSGELFPPMLYRMFVLTKKLTKDEFEKMEKNDISVFMYAEPGAMGNPGEICLIADGFRYMTCLYDDDCEVGQNDIVKKLNGFKLKFSIDVTLSTEINNNELWYYLNLGMGNHLYMRNDVFKLVGGIIFDVRQNIMYMNWRKICKDTDAANS